MKADDALRHLDLKDKFTYNGKQARVIGKISTNSLCYQVMKITSSSGCCLFLSSTYQPILLAGRHIESVAGVVYNEDAVVFTYDENVSYCISFWVYRFK